MTDYLLFHLYGPLQAWGEAAPGEVRQTADHPTKSGVLGLLGAALGLDRTADAAHRALDEGLGYAVRVDRGGRRLTDYHTVQAPPKSKVTYHTRRDQLTWVHRNDLETLLSRRDYLLDACFTVALWSRDAGVNLDHLAEALRHPHYGLYLGRRNCPPAWPIFPQRIEAPNLAEAFALLPLHEQLVQLLPQGRSSAGSTLYWEGKEEGLEPTFTTFRGDRLVSRRRRSFDRRQEHTGALRQPGG